MRCHKMPQQNGAADALAQYRKRCAQVQKSKIDTLPQKIDSLLSAGESNTKEQAAAAKQCSCPLCMQDLLDGGRTAHHNCSICGRRCCRICSYSAASSTMCRSAVCSVINKFNACQLSLESLAGECDRICRDLLRQWVVLQFKAESQLSPLRALLLVNAKHAALTSIAASSSLLQREACSPEIPEETMH